MCSELPPGIWGLDEVGKRPGNEVLLFECEGVRIYRLVSSEQKRRIVHVGSFDAQGSLRDGPEFLVTDMLRYIGPDGALVSLETPLLLLDRWMYDPETFPEDQGGFFFEVEESSFACPLDVDCVDFEISWASGDEVGSDFYRSTLCVFLFDYLGFVRDNLSGDLYDFLTPKEWSLTSDDTDYRRWFTVIPTCSAVGMMELLHAFGKPLPVLGGLDDFLIWAERSDILPWSPLEG
jgi:hypothetical protein